MSHRAWHSYRLYRCWLSRRVRQQCSLRWIGPCGRGLRRRRLRCLLLPTTVRCGRSQRIVLTRIQRVLRCHARRSRGHWHFLGHSLRGCNARRFSRCRWADLGCSKTCKIFLNAHYSVLALQSHCTTEQNQIYLNLSSCTVIEKDLPWRLWHQGTIYQSIYEYIQTEVNTSTQ